MRSPIVEAHPSVQQGLDALYASLTAQAASTPRRCRAYLSAAFSVPNAAWTKIPVDALEVADTDHMWDPANHRFVVTTPGLFSLTGTSVFSGTGSVGTQRLIAILVNGAPRATSSGPVNSGASRVNCTQIWQCSVGDTIELWGFQDTGASLSLTLTSSPTGTPGNVNNLAAVRLGP